MASVSFIADELDARTSVAAVTEHLELCFMQFITWDSETPTLSTNLGEFDQLCNCGLSFIVSQDPTNLKVRERIIMGERKWTFDPTSIGWIILDIGGFRKRGEKSVLEPGNIRANLSTELERKLYTQFKKYWLKGYKTIVEDAPRFGPSASRTLTQYFD
jgi:hypothetical protein